MTKLILDLCGGTGSWSNPYRENGYDVLNVTVPKYDVRNFKLPNEPIYGILAAPPCTMFSSARTYAKTPRDLRSGMEIVKACLNLIYEAQYRTVSDQQKLPPLKFWALENPYFGLLKWFLGKPAFIFDPWEFGDAYKKRTALWGYFKPPEKLYDEITDVLSEEQIIKHKTNSQSLPKFDSIKSADVYPDMKGKLDRQARRAITPEKFALAFYKANCEDIYGKEVNQ